MNSVSLIGRLTREPEVCYGAANQMVVARFTLAVDRGKSNGEDQGADFISIVCFGKQAETIERYVKKGQKLAINGHIQTGSYEKDGRKVYTTDVIVDRFEFIGSNANSSESRANTSSYSAPNNTFDADDDIPSCFAKLTDDDIPF